MIKSLEYHDFMQHEWPQDVVIEGGVLSMGDRLIVGGEPKSGKSVLLTQMIRGLCMGTEFVGFKVTKPRKVLYIQAELREGRLQGRFKAWHEWAALNKIDFPKDMFHIWSTNGPLNLTEKLGDGIEPDHPLEIIYREMDELKPEVIVFDPLASFHDVNENDSKEMKTLCCVVDRIKEHMNVAVVIAHHFRKGSVSDKQGMALHDRIRGSNVMTAWADSIIAIYGNQASKDQKHLEFLLRDSDANPERTLSYNYQTRSFDAIDSKSAGEAWAKEYLSKHPEGVLTSEFLKQARMAPEAPKGGQNKVAEFKDDLILRRVLRQEIGENNAKRLFLC